MILAAIRAAVVIHSQHVLSLTPECLLPGLNAVIFWLVRYLNVLVY